MHEGLIYTKIACGKRVLHLRQFLVYQRNPECTVNSVQSTVHCPESEVLSLKDSGSRAETTVSGEVRKWADKRSSELALRNLTSE